MKRLILPLFLALILLPGFALNIEKSVTGPELIDISEQLDVELTISSSESIMVDQLTDPIPIEFTAVDFPSSCKLSELNLICNIGQEFSGTSVITYKLVAISTGYGIIGGPTLSYAEGVKTTDFFRQFFVGKPKLSIELEGSSTFLPNDEIAQSIVIKNTGIRAVNGAKLTAIMDDFSYENSFSLNPEEILRVNLDLGIAPPTGSSLITAEITWSNNTKDTAKTVLFVSPSMDAERTVTSEWKLVDGISTSYVKVIFDIRNNGTTIGNYSFSSGDDFTLDSGETTLIEKTYETSAPGEKISVRDVRGTIVLTKIFTEETPEAKKGFFILMYEYVASSIPFTILVAIALASLYFVNKFNSNLMRLALLGLSAVSWILVASYFSVGAVKIPAVISRML